MRNLREEVVKGVEVSTRTEASMKVGRSSPEASTLSSSAGSSHSDHDKAWEELSLQKAGDCDMYIN